MLMYLTTRSVMRSDQMLMRACRTVATFSFKIIMIAANKNYSPQLGLCHPHTIRTSSGIGRRVTHGFRRAFHPVRAEDGDRVQNIAENGMN